MPILARRGQAFVTPFHETVFQVRPIRSTPSGLSMWWPASRKKACGACRRRYRSRGLQVRLQRGLSEDDLEKLSRRSRFRAVFDAGRPANTGAPGSATSCGGARRCRSGTACDAGWTAMRRLPMGCASRDHGAYLPDHPSMSRRPLKPGRYPIDLTSWTIDRRRTAVKQVHGTWVQRHASAGGRRRNLFLQCCVAGLGRDRRRGGLR